MMNTAPRLPRGITVVALGVFLLAFAVRVFWILRVQSPLDTVYSDMAGYVGRAESLLAHRTPSDPRVLSIYPPGTHTLLALEFLVLGRNARGPIAVAHALVGAIAAPCMTALAARLVPSLAVAALVGTLVALWYPHVSFGGLFSSEIWFSAAISLHAWLNVGQWKRAPGKLAVGLAAATAFFVRPQFLMTWGLDLGARGLGLAWHRGVADAMRSLAWLVVPVAVTIVATSVRFHRLSGHWGLIAESSGNRLWADTDVCQINSTWRTPNGETWSYWFSPPSKPARKPSDSVHFDGFIVDPDILDGIRRERLRGVSWRQRVERKLGNISLLVTGNLPWPESNYRDPPWRAALQRSFADALLFGVLPLSGLGLLLGRRNGTMLIVAANLVTVVFAAAFFFGEARYNIPYAPFALLLAVVGLYEVVIRFLRIVRRLRSARRAATPRRGPSPLFVGTSDPIHRASTREEGT